MEWAEDAEERLNKVNTEYCDGLRSEAISIAKRNRAGSVSPHYVDEAALILKNRGPDDGISDLLIAIGPAMASLSGGVGVAVVTAENTVHLSGWVAVASIALALIGMTMTGFGAALKLSR